MDSSSGGGAASGGIVISRPKKQEREPFWRSDRSCYFVQNGTKQIRLSTEKDEAWRLWHEFMARPPVEMEKPLTPGPGVLAVSILESFLDWCQRHRAPRTYQWNRENLQKFAVSHHEGLKVTGLRPYHLTRAMKPYGHWANNTKHDFISAAKRAFNWAEQEGLIEKNPLAHVKKPACEAREMAVSPAEYETIIAAISASSPTFYAQVQHDPEDMADAANKTKRPRPAKESG